MPSYKFFFIQVASMNFYEEIVCVLEKLFSKNFNLSLWFINNFHPNNLLLSQIQRKFIILLKINLQIFFTFDVLNQKSIKLNFFLKPRRNLLLNYRHHLTLFIRILNLLILPTLPTLLNHFGTFKNFFQALTQIFIKIKLVLQK